MQRKFLTKEQALQKVKQYCAYQERSHYEVQQKLYELGIRKQDHDEIISSLIEEDYLNEERFAKAFAGGKFRMKDWGRKKIYYALKDEQYLVRKRKTIDFMMQKGYESDLVTKVVNELSGK